MNYDEQELAEIILQNVGGFSNIVRISHCMTRLRFHLKNSSLANTELLSNTKGIMSIILKKDQYQILIGPQVSDVYRSVKKIMNILSS